MEEATRDWIKLHNQELHSLFNCLDVAAVNTIRRRFGQVQLHKLTEGVGSNIHTFSASAQDCASVQLHTPVSL
jgi:hypothetical protein